MMVKNLPTVPGRGILRRPRLLAVSGKAVDEYDTRI
jgi:hypothetical protein